MNIVITYEATAGSCKLGSTSSAVTNSPCNKGRRPYCKTATFFNNTFPASYTFDSAVSMTENDDSFITLLCEWQWSLKCIIAARALNMSTTTSRNVLIMGGKPCSDRGKMLCAVLVLSKLLVKSTSCFALSKILCKAFLEIFLLNIEKSFRFDTLERRLFMAFSFLCIRSLRLLS